VVETLQSEEISKALLYMLEDRKRWRQWANNGIAGVWRHYSWAAHVEKYMKEIRRLLRRDKKRLRRQHAIIQNDEKSYMPLVKTALISDNDNTLLGNKQALKKLTDWLKSQRARLAFGIATGRTIESTVAILKKNQVGIPDVLITSVGSEIHYGQKL